MQYFICFHIKIKQVISPDSSLEFLVTKDSVILAVR